MWMAMAFKFVSGPKGISFKSVCAYAGVYLSGFGGGLTIMIKRAMSLDDTD
jgi:hypothetical protein